MTTAPGNEGIPSGVRPQDVAELQQLLAFFDEAIVETGPEVPPVVYATMASNAQTTGAKLVAQGLNETSMTIAMMVFAYFAGRKAERAGLEHRS